MAGWHHRLDGQEFWWAPEVGDGQGGLECWYSWGRKESDMTEWLNWTELNWKMKYYKPSNVKNLGSLMLIMDVLWMSHLYSNGPPIRKGSSLPRSPLSSVFCKAVFSSQSFTFWLLVKVSHQSLCPLNSQRHRSRPPNGSCEMFSLCLSWENVSQGRMGMERVVEHSNRTTLCNGALALASWISLKMVLASLP